MASLEKLISAHLKAFREYFFLVKIDANPKIVHDLRVEYKKSRSIIRLIRTGKNKLKIPPLLKDFYAAAGRVRELQLQEQTMKDVVSNPELPAYFNLLQKQLTFAITTLKEKSTVVDIEKSLHSITKKFPKKISAIQALGFINNKAASLLFIFEKKNKKDADIHEIRKIIKDLMYSFHTLESINLKYVIPLSASEEKIFHELANELGLFQDKCNALALLRMSMFRNLPEEEKSSLRLIRSTMMKGKIESRKNVLNKLLSASPLFTSLINSKKKTFNQIIAH
ncbi:MAG: CHAD domain-containing protein [Sphingobacteriales bacterium]